jgi:hypothetical protein
MRDQPKVRKHASWRFWGLEILWRFKTPGADIQPDRMPDSALARLCGPLERRSGRRRFRMPWESGPVPARIWPVPPGLPPWTGL